MSINNTHQNALHMVTCHLYYQSNCLGHHGFNEFDCQDQCILQKKNKIIFKFNASQKGLDEIM